MVNHPSRKRAAQKAHIEKLAKAFNEWMRRFTADPSSFERECETLGAFIRDLNGGNEPTYGEECAAYLMKLMGEIK